MIYDLNLRVSPRVAATQTLLKNEIEKATGVKIDNWRICSRSIDARQRQVFVNLRVEASKGEPLPPLYTPVNLPKLSSDAPKVIIVGAGPGGLFAALRAIETGIKPILLERGRDVDSRRKNIADISRLGVVDADSNYCFGEGGAGAYSDGKLYTRSKKRGPVKEILSLLVQHSADPAILVDAHPHIGSDKLPKVISNIRNAILEAGGEVYFESKVTGLLLDNGVAKGVRLADGRKFEGPVVLATGHSARDVYRFLKEQGVSLESKALAIGVRLEHPQELIDRIQYHSPKGRGEFLPAAEYSFTAQVDGRGVYSFCMCPGGVIVPSASGPEQNVVNGMSASGRSGRWANSGMVVELHPEDFPEYSEYGELCMMELQESLERNFYHAAGNSLKAPAQRMTDFVNGKVSTTLESSSFPNGLISLPVHFLLPPQISDRLREGFRIFGKRAKGFLTPQATVVGLESRTSSPVRIPRDNDSGMHVGIANLYPVGEGAGYAGGIVSAAIDGRNAIDHLIKNMQ